MTLETRAVYPVELELRDDGRRLTGRFPYSQGPGDRMATVANRGRTRKERISGDAFGWQIRKFAELQKQYSQVAQDAIDTAQARALAQELERRNVHILSGHDFDRPLGSMAQGAEIESTREAVTFTVTLPPVADQPAYMVDAVKMVRSGMIRGISPGFYIPPATVVRNAERLEPEPGNADVLVRVVENAILPEMSLVTRPAYSDTGIDVRAGDFGTPERTRRVWL